MGIIIKSHQVLRVALKSSESHEVTAQGGCASSALEKYYCCYLFCYCEVGIAKAASLLRKMAQGCDTPKATVLEPGF
jgi:hypothetical protein